METKKQSRIEQLEKINVLRTDLSVALADDLLIKQRLTVDCPALKEFLITVAENKHRENIIKGMYYTLLSNVDMAVFNLLCLLRYKGKIKNVEYGELPDDEFAAAVKTVLSTIPILEVSPENETLACAIFDNYLKIFKQEVNDLPF